MPDFLVKTINIKGVDITVRYIQRAVDEKYEGRIQVIKKALEFLPPQHLKHIPVITIKSLGKGYSGGGSARTGMPGGPYIRISLLSFGKRINREYSQTLLHECGHIIDWAYDCMKYLKTNHKAEYRALKNHPHRGRTQGASEHYADAYSSYLQDKLKKDSLRLRAIELSPAFNFLRKKQMQQEDTNYISLEITSRRKTSAYG